MIYIKCIKCENPFKVSDSEHVYDCNDDLFVSWSGRHCPVCRGQIPYKEFASNSARVYLVKEVDPPKPETIEKIVKEGLPCLQRMLHATNGMLAWADLRVALWDWSNKLSEAIKREEG